MLDVKKALVSGQCHSNLTTGQAFYHVRQEILRYVAAGTRFLKGPQQPAHMWVCYLTCGWAWRFAQAQDWTAKQVVEAFSRIEELGQISLTQIWVCESLGMTAGSNLRSFWSWAS